MARRYRGENSNVDDIAARFDKHLDDDTVITASASVVNVPPGQYKLAQVLKENKRPTRYSIPDTRGNSDRREYQREWYRRKKARESNK
jgi:hypothetical protein